MGRERKRERSIDAWLYLSLRPRPSERGQPSSSFFSIIKTPSQKKKKRRPSTSFLQVFVGQRYKYDVLPPLMSLSMNYSEIERKTSS